jgi:flavorubredoxin
MHCEQEIAKNLYWIGGDDRRLGIFEGHHPVPYGMAYNNYLLLDEKTVLFDTIDRAVEERFFETLEYLLSDRELDYIIVQHMEPDHSATLGTVARQHPNAKLVCTAVCKQLIVQFFGPEFGDRCIVVKDGDSLETGTHTLAFATAPMVHWPEVMVTYDVEDKVLFSADAFGSFGALNGKIFDSDYDFDDELLDESRRYYTNIVGKYGTQVKELLDKADTLDIQLICPLHGPMIRDNIEHFKDKYRLWADYEPEDQGVVIAYASVYGGTRDVAEKLALKLSDLGIHDLALFDLSVTDPSYVLSEAFRVSNIVLASVTYNAGVFPKMNELVDAMVAHNLRRRRFSFIQNGSWGPIAGKKMMKAIESIPEAEVVGELFTIKSRMRDDQDDELDALAQAIYDSIAEAPTPIVGAVRPQAAPATVERVGNVPVAPGAPTPLKPPVVKKAQPKQETKVIQIWRCTFCGYQAEVPKGTDMSTFVCPVCLRSGEGQFVLVREKMVPV